MVPSGRELFGRGWPPIDRLNDRNYSPFRFFGLIRLHQERNRALRVLFLLDFGILGVFRLLLLVKHLRRPEIIQTVTNIS